MAYFPNGTSGAIYEEQYCCNCVHDDADRGCPIMMLHNLYNYDQLDTDKSDLKVVLGTLIPESKDGLSTEQCSMFLPRDDPEAEEAERQRLASQPTKYEAALAEMRARQAA